MGSNHVERHVLPGAASHSPLLNAPGCDSVQQLGADEEHKEHPANDSARRPFPHERREIEMDGEPFQQMNVAGGAIRPALPRKYRKLH